MDIQRGKGCHCRDHHCRVHSCECFANDRPCSSLCRCIGCPNFSTPERIPAPALYRCACQKSLCVKNYCECFKAGRTCGFGCKCQKGCLNGEALRNRRRSQRPQTKRTEGLQPPYLAHQTNWLWLKTNKGSNLRRGGRKGVSA